MGVLIGNSGEHDFREAALILLDAAEEGGFDVTRRSEAMRTAFVTLGKPALLLEIVTVMISSIAIHTEETPRSLYEKLFSRCPSDNDWAGMVGRWREEQGD